ncbi:transmembrane protease serine 9-like [Cebidichthys violaceus]|uniref:transmembrane protease serine 9-like n=1 Tax=Cebidichthys violaceus TaxID=271503 RepID=UPI0035C9CF31
MSFYQFLCASTVMIILLSGGCCSQLPVCGRAARNTRIVGGQDAPPGSWPWLVSLNSNGKDFCAGSLIHNQWVLTAAHCLSSRSDLLTTTVNLGRQSQSGPNFNEVSTSLERIICHPSYNRQTNDNDICLLKLSAPVDFTDYIQPVCLASAGSTFHTGVSSYVAGFGDTQADSSSRADILQEVKVPIVGNNECKCSYPSITDNMICAGFSEGGRDACQGDSGAPLVTKKGFMWIQSGIVSFGNGCAKPMTPGGHTRVSQYQEWITKITDSSEPGFVTYSSSGVDSDLNITCSTIQPNSATITNTTTPSIHTISRTPTTKTTPPTTTTSKWTPEKPIESVFDSGDNVVHFCHFTYLSLLVSSLYVLQDAVTEPYKCVVEITMKVEFEDGRVPSKRSKGAHHEETKTTKVPWDTAEMSFYQFLCASTVMIILLSGGCHSQLPVCGRAAKNTRIVGGQDASAGSWPWLVSLNSEDIAFCAGSLIHNQWVLTAAHCLTDDLLTTTVNLGRQSQSGPNFNEVSRGLERIICHPSYDFFSEENDICLLKLSAPVNFTDYIQPVCLASAGSTFHTGVSSWVAGFGDTQADSFSGADILQEVKVPIVGNNECKCAYPSITDNMICAGFREGGKDACQGDSGAPLVTKKGFMWIQSGIVSFGNGCAKPMTPGGYTRVSQYQEWITKITDSSEPGFVTYSSSGVDSDLNITCSTIQPTTITTTTTSSIHTTTMIPTTATIPTTKWSTEEPKYTDSVFDSGDNVVHFCHFTYLSLLVSSLYVLVL